MSLTEFEWFKHEVRHVAFTCRLSSCPNALVGFENERLLASHESAHVGHICKVSGCQYPPFDSKESLKRHMKKQHETMPSSNPSRQSIRSRLQDPPGYSTKVHESQDAEHPQDITEPKEEGNIDKQQSPQAANMAQTQAIMDNMDIPEEILQQLSQSIQLGPEVRKWRDLRAWVRQNPNSIPSQLKNELGPWQRRQFQEILKRRQTGLVARPA